MNKTNSGNEEQPSRADRQGQERQPTGQPPDRIWLDPDDARAYCGIVARSEYFRKLGWAEYVRADLVEADQREWQPMETAPKNDDEVLLCFVDGVEIAFWRDDAQAWDSALGWIRAQPTHWMPLPDPPTQAAESEFKAIETMLDKVQPEYPNLSRDELRETFHSTYGRLAATMVEQPSTSDVLSNPDRGMSSRNLPKSKCKHCRQPIRRPEGEPWIHVNSGLWTCRKGDTYINSAEPVPPTQATRSAKRALGTSELPADSPASESECSNKFCTDGWVDEEQGTQDGRESYVDQVPCQVCCAHCDPPESEITELRQRELGPTCAHCNERRILEGESTWGICALCWNKQLEVIGSLRKQLAAAETRVGELQPALQFYADPSNLEQFVTTGSNEIKGTSWGELDPDISNTAQAVLDAQPTSEKGE